MRILQWLIAGSRGGPNRARILITIKENPMNANQIGEKLGLDYRSIRHHINVLEKNKLVTSLGQRYGKVYFLSEELERNFSDFEEILYKFGKTAIKKGDL
jgi:DNA-binding transcriptional ArsR family regulator